MAKITLLPTEEGLAKRFIKNVFSASSAANVPQSAWYDREYADYSFTKKAADMLGMEIVTRNCDFLKNDLDNQLRILSQLKLKSPNSGRRIQRTPEDLAKYVAWFCQQQGIIWDDTALSTIEQDEIKKTILGSTLYKAGCFLSTVNNSSTAKASKTPRAASANSSSNSSGPVNGYKASGAHSQDIPNLIGGANMKVYVSGSVYGIIADKIGKNTPNAYITPLKATGSGVVQVSKAQAEKVNFGSGNGYTDCMCWFDNSTDAQAFANMCLAKFGNKFANIRLVQDKAAPNGYFRVSTEFGDAYIKANKLNEELTEGASLEEANEKPYENASKNFQITDVDLYDKWTQKSYS